MTCFECHHIIIPEGRSYIIQQQMAALDRGLLALAAVMPEIYDGVLAEHGGKDGAPGMMDNLRRTVEEKVKVAMQEDQGTRKYGR